MPIPKEINLLKPKLDWKYLVALVVVVVVLLACVGIGTWIYGQLKGTVKAVTKPAEEPTI